MINIKIHQKRGGHKLHCHREEKMYEKKKEKMESLYLKKNLERELKFQKRL